MELLQYEMRTKSPAVEWEEAFPIGNGHIGAMVYGDVPENRIILSENTFYSGRREKLNFQETAAVSFQKMRKLAEQDQYEEVHKEAEHFIGIRGNYGTNMPAGELLICYGEDGDSVALLERKLNIKCGIASRRLCVTKAAETASNSENLVEEEIFASNPDHVLAVRIKSRKKLQVMFSMSMNENGRFACIVEAKNGLCLKFQTHAYETMHCDDTCGVTMDGELRVVTDGSEQLYKGKHLQVKNATYIYAFLATWTDFCSQLGLSKPRCFQFSDNDMQGIYDRHIRDVETSMKRSTLVIDTAQKETEQMEENQLSFLYQYGRYLLLCSSREDSVLPAHLQGIWNDNVACRIGWTCDLHLDINTQMNYWPADVTGLPETLSPLVRWLKDVVVPMGKITAEKCYNLSGWVGELVSNAWGYAYPYWATPIAPCPTGGVWLLTELYEHYRFSMDSAYLAKEIFPLLKSAVCFFKDYVFMDETGHYTCGPSISPENSFEQNDKLYQISNGCTYELLMIRELFTIYLEACSILHETEYEEEIREKLNRLLPYRLTEAGTIAEYHHDLKIPDLQHRHTSHLLGLFPFSQLTPEKAPGLCHAAEKTIQQKITPIANWEDTGWASSLLMLYEARLRHGDAAYMHIKRVIHKLKGKNQMIFHPPTRGAGSFAKVYELDGNTGMTSAIAEMLVQSQDGIIRLLPALPGEWKSGAVTGLHARQGVVVDLKWENHELTELSCTSTKSGAFRVQYQTHSLELALTAFHPCVLKQKDLR